MMRHDIVISQMLADLRSLTPRERLRLAGYAVLLFVPLIAALIMLTWCVPGLDQVLRP